MFINVDLPEPDDPMIATYSPRSPVTDPPRRACTVASPSPYTFVTVRTSSTGWSGAARSAKGGIKVGIIPCHPPPPPPPPRPPAALPGAPAPPPGTTVAPAAPPADVPAPGGAAVGTGGRFLGRDHHLL